MTRWLLLFKNFAGLHVDLLDGAFRQFALDHGGTRVSPGAATLLLLGFLLQFGREDGSAELRRPVGVVIVGMRVKRNQKDQPKCTLQLVLKGYNQGVSCVHNL